MGAHARALKDDMSPAKVEEKLQEVVEQRPKTRHLLDFSIVGKALVAAVVVALILWLLVNAQLAAIALVVVFIGGWLLMAQLSYDRRRETHDVRAGDDADDSDSPEPEESGYQGDRGEVEAQKEQQDDDEDSGEAPPRNRTAPDRQRTTG